MRRRPDVVRVESSSGVFDAFESLTITNDIEGLTEATFALGDENSWEALERVIAPGQEFSVLVNDKPRMRGRSEVVELPASAGEGFTTKLVCRTKLADANYASADPAIRVTGASLKDLILALYAPLGFSEADFNFAEANARDVMTGKNGGGKPPVDLAPIQLEQAKVNPPESIRECAERHLKRFHMTHWDAPDGRILVGAPDDTQAALYRAICKRRGPATQANNVLAVRRLRDWSEVPSDVSVYGSTPGRDVARATVRGVSADLDLAAVYASTGHFYRPVLIPSEQVKTSDAALAQATRERSARSKRKDAWEVTFDGWSYWDGNTQTNFAHNTVIDLDVEGSGASARGSYLVHRCELNFGRDGLTTKLTAVAPGVWTI